MTSLDYYTIFEAKQPVRLLDLHDWLAAQREAEPDHIPDGSVGNRIWMAAYGFQSGLPDRTAARELVQCQLGPLVKERRLSFLSYGGFATIWRLEGTQDALRLEILDYRGVVSNWDIADLSAFLRHELILPIQDQTSISFVGVDEWSRPLSRHTAAMVVPYAPKALAHRKNDYELIRILLARDGFYWAPHSDDELRWHDGKPKVCDLGSIVPAYHVSAARKSGLIFNRGENTPLIRDGKPAMYKTYELQATLGIRSESLPTEDMVTPSVWKAVQPIMERQRSQSGWLDMLRQARDSSSELGL